MVTSYRKACSGTFILFLLSIKFFSFLPIYKITNTPREGERILINNVTSGQQYSIAGSQKAAGQSNAGKAAAVSQTSQSSKVDTVEIGTTQDTSVTYSKVSNSKLSTNDIDALKAEADKATENLRKLVEELILKQNKNYVASTKDGSTSTLYSTEDVAAAQKAISAGGEYSVDAVSDNLFNFAVAVSGGDKSKLSELVAAIDKGFAAAKDTLGGKLPDISQQTYDATMEKLNNWANGTDTAGTASEADA